MFLNLGSARGKQRSILPVSLIDLTFYAIIRCFVLLKF